MRALTAILVLLSGHSPAGAGVCLTSHDGGTIGGPECQINGRVKILVEMLFPGGQPVQCARGLPCLTRTALTRDEAGRPMMLERYETEIGDPQGPDPEALRAGFAAARDELAVFDAGLRSYWQSRFCTGSQHGSKEYSAPFLEAGGIIGADIALTAAADCSVAAISLHDCPRTELHLTRIRLDACPE